MATNFASLLLPEPNVFGEDGFSVPGIDFPPQAGALSGIPRPVPLGQVSVAPIDPFTDIDPVIFAASSPASVLESGGRTAEDFFPDPGGPGPSPDIGLPSGVAGPSGFDPSLSLSEGRSVLGALQNPALTPGLAGIGFGAFGEALGVPGARGITSGFAAAPAIALGLAPALGPAAIPVAGLLGATLGISNAGLGQQALAAIDQALGSVGIETSLSDITAAGRSDPFGAADFDFATFGLGLDPDLDIGFGAVSPSQNPAIEEAFGVDQLGAPELGVAPAFSQESDDASGFGPDQSGGLSGQAAAGTGGPDTSAGEAEAEAAGGDGDSDGDGWVICTALSASGAMPDRLYAVSSAYMRKMPKVTVRGYHAWGIPYVRLMDKHPIFARLALPIATARARHIKETMAGRRGAFGGAICKRLVEWPSWLIGKALDAYDNRNQDSVAQT